MERVSDLLSVTSYESVEEKIKLHYGDKFLCEFRDLYRKLREMDPDLKAENDLYIYIRTFSENDGEYIPEYTFDENDASLEYDVCAYEKGGDTVYSIAASSYSDFIRYYVDNETLDKFCAASILAHCLWEITAYGFEDNCSAN